MRPNSSLHPTVQQLADFVEGRLHPAERESVCEHLNACETCADVLDGLPPNTLGGLLFGSTPREGLASPVLPSGDIERSLVEQPARDSEGVPPELLNHPRYRVVELLGSGGMGNVFKAEHLLMRRPVALKVIRSRFVNRPDAVQRFQQEVRAAATLSHPNIVSAFDADQVGSLHFLVMEYVSGENIADYVARVGPLPVVEACRHIRGAAAGLQHAFECGMVHRDIKPQNLMLDADGQVKILDFGLARLARESEPAAADGDMVQTPATQLTAVGAVLGTPDYIAPEQIDNSNKADIRSDIYSLGCTLRFLLTGQTPFPGGTPSQKVIGHLERMPRPIHDLRQDIPARLARITSRMMAKAPAERYQTPAEVMAALEPFTDLGVARRLRRTRIRWIAAAAVLLAASVFAAPYAPAVYRIATDQGLVTIETDDPDVEVTILRAGQKVVIHDLKTGNRLTLRSGVYSVQLGASRSPLTLETESFTLKRGGHEIVRVNRGPKPLWADVALPMKPTRPSRRLASCSYDKTVRIYDVEAQTTLHTIKAHDGPIERVVFSPNGRWMVTSSHDKTAKVWDGRSLELLTTLARPEELDPAVFSPDGRLLAIGGRQRLVELWSTETWSLARALHGASGGVQALAFSSDGKTLAAASSDRAVYLWDTTTGDRLPGTPSHDRVVDCVLFSPRGTLLATSGESSPVKLWDSRSNLVRALAHLSGGDHPSHVGVERLAFSIDGNTLATAGDDAVVKLWDLETFQERRALPHEAGVWGVDFSHDGRLLATGSMDCRVTVWDLVTFRQVATFKEHTHWVTCVTFVPEP